MTKIMKSFTEFKTKKRVVKTTKEILQIVLYRGYDADLNDLDVSRITNMSGLFKGALGKFNGNISEWDVSNVEIMHTMFYGSAFKGDISKWDVSKVENIDSMFELSAFNGDVSTWNITDKVTRSKTSMQSVFRRSNCTSDLSNWKLAPKFIIQMGENMPGNPEWLVKFKHEHRGTITGEKYGI